MYAAVVTLAVDPGRAAEAAVVLMNGILPRVRSAPGFISGYWLEPVGGRGLSFVVFASEADARAATPPGDDWAAPGVTVEGVEIRRVAVTVP